MDNWRGKWRAELATEPAAWFCDVLWGGNTFASQSFVTPGLKGHLLAVPAGTHQAGGDLHHITVCGGGVFTKFFLLDVSGHGEVAAEWSRRLQPPLRRLMEVPDNAEILRELNAIMHGYGELGRFATAVAATYNQRSKKWVYAYAGHPYMLIYKEGRWQELPATGERTVPIGIIHETAYYQTAISLAPRNRLLMFTDAIMEMRHTEGGRLGVEGVMELLNDVREQDLETLYQSFVGALIRMNGGESFEDDLTLLLLEH